MILTAEQAREIGEALLDAADAVTNKEVCQSVVNIGEVIVALPADTLVDEWQHIAYVTESQYV